MPQVAVSFFGYQSGSKDRPTRQRRYLHVVSDRNAAGQVNARYTVLKDMQIFVAPQGEPLAPHIDANLFRDLNPNSNELI